MSYEKISPGQALKAVQAETEHAMAAEPVEIIEKRWTINGEPFRCYVWPATIAQDAEILAASRRGGDYEEILQTLVTRARNRDRSRIFDQTHISELRAWGMSETIRNVVRQINLSDPTPEEIAGNSEGPSADSSTE